jgi:hypothetical protein
VFVLPRVAKQRTLPRAAAARNRYPALESVKEATFIYEMGKNDEDRLENLNGRSRLENVGQTVGKY